MKKNTKPILLITIFLLMIISFWLITLNLSFKNKAQNFNRDGLSFEEFQQSVKDIFAKSPLSTRNTQPTNNTSSIINQLTEKVLENTGTQEHLNTETQDIDTSNWQTYKNENLGIKFKYPNNWKVNSEIFNPPLETINYYSKNTLLEKISWSINVKENLCEGDVIDCPTYTIKGYFIGDQDNSFYENILKELKKCAEDNYRYCLASKIEEKEINNIKSIIFEGGGMCEQQNAYFFVPNYLIIFEDGGCGTYQRGFNGLHTKFISTFKFLD